MTTPQTLCEVLIEKYYDFDDVRIRGLHDDDNERKRERYRVREWVRETKGYKSRRMGQRGNREETRENEKV